jgi:hypothetical protein
VIQIAAQASVLVMHEPVSFRMGIDGMVAVARVVLAQEPLSGALAETTFVETRIPRIGARAARKRVHWSSGVKSHERHAESDVLGGVQDARGARAA